MYNAIYHIETGLVVSKGCLENDMFSTIILDEEYSNERCILINHENKIVYDLTKIPPYLKLLNMNSRINSLKAKLLETDSYIIESLTDKTIKNERIELRKQINELEEQRNIESYKNIIVENKYKILKYIEGEEDNISSILKLIKKIFGEVVDVQ